MAANSITPNMNLLVPTVGAELGPTWAVDLNTSLGTIDTHNHSSGQGVQINPAGININASLTFTGNALTNAGYLGIKAQGAGIATPVNSSLYVSVADLYFQDGNGNAVRITSGGSVNATSSGIASGTATAAFVSSVLVVDQSTGVSAPIDAATYILRYNGSYPSPSGNYISLAAPSSLSGGYQITFPATAPASSGAFLTESTAGVLSYTNVDGSTLTISAGVVGVPANGITSTQLATNSVGTSQVQNQSLTYGKLVAPAFASSGSFSGSTSSTTPQVISGSVVSIPGQGRPIVITLAPIGIGGTVQSTFQNSATGDWMRIDLYRNGSQFARTSQQGLTGTIGNPSAITFFDDTLTASSVTYEIFISSGNGSGLSSINSAQLVAYSL